MQFAPKYIQNFVMYQPKKLYLTLSSAIETGKSSVVFMIYAVINIKGRSNIFKH